VNEAASVDSRLAETQRAFDGVASEYDGPLGNNALVQHMRAELWRSVATSVPARGRLLDLGCGTGLDAQHFASLGYQVVATDWSPAMVARSRARAAESGMISRITVYELGLHQLDQLKAEHFDGIYSNLGPLNCAIDLSTVANRCARLVTMGGVLIASVMSRSCVWEMLFYTLRGDLRRARVRTTSGMVPVPLNGQTVWTRFYSPREFSCTFEPDFRRESVQALSLFLPPPYLVGLYERHPHLGSLAEYLDRRLGGMPILRGLGDHFLAVLRKHG
jgi:ubiquinone/menaquinone biosynthesis C-methylase UbiE